MAPSHEHAHAGTSFDERAADWDDDGKVARSRALAAAIRDRVPIDDTSRVFEYGAGTGLATQFLVGDGLGSVVLADTSAGMREVMAAKVADGRLPADTTVMELDLAHDDPPDAIFDVVVTVMTLHHIPDLAAVLDGLRRVLSDEGRLCIVDLESDDGSFHAHLDDFEGHDGFDRSTLTEALVTAGFRAPTWDVVHHVERDDGTWPLFLAITAPG